MKNINRDYLVKVDVRTAKLTPAPKELKFFMTDVWTSNIFFELEPKESISDLINNAPYENAPSYSLTLRVVKPNGEPKTIDAIRLENHSFFVADLTVDFVDIPGIYKCEVFIDAVIDGRLERNTTEPFEYKVEPSIFYNLDDIIDTKILAIEDIATIDYVNSLAVGGVSLEGYATIEQLNTKADEEHTHDDYITQAVLDETMAGINIPDINLENFTVSNSISINRKPNMPVGQYSTAIGYNVTATSNYSHAEGYKTIASGESSHAEGKYTVASGDHSHSEGVSSEATGESSHAEGYWTEANGYASHTEGFHTIANGSYQHVQGKYNIEDAGREYAHIVGNGTSEVSSNAHTLDWGGNAWFAGDVFVGGDSQDFNSKKLATEDFVNESVKNVEIPDSYDDTELRKLINSKADKNDSKLYGSVSIGNDCVAGKVYTVAIGEGAYCGSMNQIAMGSWNVIDEADKYAFIFGDGDYYDDEERRSNCMTIDRSGNCWHKGNIYVGSNSHDRYSKKVLTEGDIYFDSSGYLVVNINGTTKRFAPVG